MNKKCYELVKTDLERPIDEMQNDMEITETLYQYFNVYVHCDEDYVVVESALYRCELEYMIGCWEHDEIVNYVLNNYN